MNKGQNNNQKIDELRRKLSIGELQLDQGKGVNGEQFMNKLISECNEKFTSKPPNQN